LAAVPLLKVNEAESAHGIKDGVVLVDVRLRAYKWLILDLDRVRLMFARNVLERLRRFDGKRSSGKCEGKIVPYSDGSLALRYMSTTAVPTTPEIVGEARIYSQETQSLNRAERKWVDGVRGLQVQVCNISREWVYSMTGCAILPRPKQS